MDYQNTNFLPASLSFFSEKSSQSSGSGVVAVFIKYEQEIINRFKKTFLLKVKREYINT